MRGLVDGDMQLRHAAMDWLKVMTQDGLESINSEEIAELRSAGSGCA